MSLKGNIFVLFTKEMINAPFIVFKGTVTSFNTRRLLCKNTPTRRYDERHCHQLQYKEATVKIRLK